MPGGNIGGVPIEFEFLGNRLGSILTNEWDRQVFIITWVDGATAPGTYPGGIRARVSGAAGFVNEVESSAD